MSWLMMRWIRSCILIQSIVEYLNFNWFPVSFEFQFEWRKIRSLSASFSMCRWSTWRGFLKSMLVKFWFSSCFICSGREVWMNSVNFRILRDRLTKETHDCRWCMEVGFLDLVQSLLADRLPVLIRLAFSSVRLKASRSTLVLFDSVFG